MNRRQFLAGSAAMAAAAMSFNPKGIAQQAATTSPPMERIDCHLHINHFDRTIEDTIRHMDATGTTRAFILPLETGEGGVTLRAETVLHAYHQYKDRIYPFCQTDIRKPDVLDKIRAYHLLGCRGVGEQKEHLPLSDKRVEALIALCDELDWPITLHFQDGANGYNQGLAETLETYLKRYQRVRIIGHAQTWWANISADVPETGYPKGPVKPGGLLDRLLQEYPNVYGDLSAGSGYNALTRDEEFTAGFLERNHTKLLFGSDCPCYDGKGEKFNGVCFSTQLQQLLNRMITDKEQLANIYYRNALKVIGEA